MKLNKQTKTFLYLLTFAGMTVSANAAVIFTESFEDPSVDGGTPSFPYTNVSPTNWSGNGGINHNNAADINTPFGNQVVWTNGNGDGMVLADGNIGLLQAGTYTLTFNVSARVGTADYEVFLRAGGVTLDSVANDTGISSQDMSHTDSLVYVATAGDAQIGQELSIRLDIVNDLQPQFDNIVLDFEPVAIPEPSTTALLGLGGLALVFRRRK